MKDDYNIVITFRADEVCTAALKLKEASCVTFKSDSHAYLPAPIILLVLKVLSVHLS